MEELYRIIEQKIKDAGYPRAISGEMVYGDICDQIEGKENTCLLINGDGRDLSIIKDKSIDGIITDHPYDLQKALTVSK